MRVSVALVVLLLAAPGWAVVVAEAPSQCDYNSTTTLPAGGGGYVQVSRHRCHYTIGTIDYTQRLELVFSQRYDPFSSDGSPAAMVVFLAEEARPADGSSHITDTVYVGHQDTFYRLRYHSSENRLGIQSCYLNHEASAFSASLVKGDTPFMPVCLPQGFLVP